MILDVGSGSSSFSREVKGSGVKVISLDGKSFSWTGDRCGENDILGAAQYLPFKDNVFDETISCWCFPYLGTDTNKTLLEMIRVTKPEGKIKIHPVKSDSKFRRRHFDEDFIYLEECYPLTLNKTLIINKIPGLPMCRWNFLVEKALSKVSFCC